MVPSDVIFSLLLFYFEGFIGYYVTGMYKKLNVYKLKPRLNCKISQTNNIFICEGPSTSRSGEQLIDKKLQISNRLQQVISEEWLMTID